MCIIYWKRNHRLPLLEKKEKGITGAGFIFQNETIKRKKKNLWMYIWFLRLWITRQWRTVIPERWETNEVSSVYCLEKIATPCYKEGDPWRCLTTSLSVSSMVGGIPIFPSIWRKSWRRLKSPPRKADMRARERIGFAWDSGWVQLFLRTSDRPDLSFFLFSYTLCAINFLICQVTLN